MNTVVPDLGLKHHGQPNDHGYYPRAGVTLRMSPLSTSPPVKPLRFRMLLLTLPKSCKVYS